MTIWFKSLLRFQFLLVVNKIFKHFSNYGIRFQEPKLKCMILVLAKVKGSLSFRGHQIKPWQHRVYFKPSSKLQRNHKIRSLISFICELTYNGFPFLTNYTVLPGRYIHFVFHMFRCTTYVKVSQE